MKTILKTLLACLVLTGLMVSVQAQQKTYKMTTKRRKTLWRG